MDVKAIAEVLGDARHERDAVAVFVRDLLENLTSDHDMIGGTHGVIGRDVEFELTGSRLGIPCFPWHLEPVEPSAYLAHHRVQPMMGLM